MECCKTDLQGYGAKLGAKNGGRVRYSMLARWKENLRMSREIICTELRPFVERKLSRFRQPISVKTRVAVTLWRLATNTEYRTIAELFGLGRSTVCEIVIDTCDALAKLAPHHVYVPQNESLREVVRGRGFEWRWGFPQTAGAIDGTHIPILKPHHCTTAEKDTILFLCKHL